MPRNNVETRITISFFGSGQMPYLMICKEYYEDGKIIYAEVIYNEDRNSSEIVITGDVMMKTGKRGINLYGVLK